MSEMNRPQVAKSFEMIRQLLKSSVPPCTTTIDEPCHYESMAITGDTRHLFGYCIAHREVVTIGFNREISDHDLRQLFSASLREKMNEERRIEVREAEVHNLWQDLQDAVNKLQYYFDEKGWTKA